MSLQEEVAEAVPMEMPMIHEDDDQDVMKSPVSTVYPKQLIGDIKNVVHNFNSKSNKNWYLLINHKIVSMTYTNVSAKNKKRDIFLFNYPVN